MPRRAWLKARSSPMEGPRCGQRDLGKGENGAAGFGRREVEPLHQPGAQIWAWGAGRDSPLQHCRASLLHLHLGPVGPSSHHPACWTAHGKKQHWRDSEAISEILVEKSSSATSSPADSNPSSVPCHRAFDACSWEQPFASHHDQ